MKSVFISWAMSAGLAICLTLGMSSLTSRRAAKLPVTLAQADGAVAVPGSADAQGSGSADDDYQAGQAQPPKCKVACTDAAMGGSGIGRRHGTTPWSCIGLG